MQILRSIKWANKGNNDSSEKGNNDSSEEGTFKREHRICINDDASSYSEVLKKSLVGKFVIKRSISTTSLYLVSIIDSLIQVWHETLKTIMQYKQIKTL